MQNTFFGPVTPSVSNTIIQGVCIAFTIRNCFLNISSGNISITSVEHSGIGVYVTMGSEVTFHNVNISH